jgi:uncharacterized protein YbjT (DUF2867 family)
MYTENLLAYNGLKFIENGKVMWPAKQIVHPWVTSEDIGAVATSVLINPAQHIGKAYPITSFFASGQQIADALSMRLNKKFTAEPLDPDTMFNKLVKELGNDRKATEAESQQTYLYIIILLTLGAFSLVSFAIYTV